MSIPPVCKTAHPHAAPVGSAILESLVVTRIVPNRPVALIVNRYVSSAIGPVSVGGVITYTVIGAASILIPAQVTPVVMSSAMSSLGRS